MYTTGDEAIRGRTNAWKWLAERPYRIGAMNLFFDHFRPISDGNAP
jgi:hypothetical protein